MRWKTATCLALVLLLAGCSTTSKEPERKKTGGGYYLDDGPPNATVDLAKVKDAVPRTEPPSSTGNKPYVVFGKRYVPLKSSKGFRQKGTASWYGKKFHGKRTSSGEAYDMYQMTAAHTVLPIPSYARVTNLDNGRSVIVRVNDRGPFKHNRVMDLSYAAALRLDVVKSGTAPVEIASIGEQTNTGIAHGSPSKNSEIRLPASGDPQLFIQMGAFSNQHAALSLRKQLQGGGYPDTFISRFSQGQIDMYRVRIGPIKQPADADFILADLHNAGFPDAHFIVE